MQTNASAARATPTTLKPSKHGIVALAGYGLRIAVERGHLAVSDGIGADRRSARFHRATSRISRLVVLGHTGTVSLDALRWIHDVGAAFVQIDADGRVIVATAPAALDDSHLRRAQALAVGNGIGIAIARELLRDKLEGQTRLLASLPGTEESQAVINGSGAALGKASSPDSLRQVEAQAALAYWTAWRAIPVRFARKDLPRIPDHWLTFGRRKSPLDRGPRRAANPGNALLNYLYALLEAEARIALLTIGLDPGMGVLHADQPSRDSLALDIMEAVRPEVDSYVLDLLLSRTFTVGDFGETRAGVCRVAQPLPRMLADTCARWRALVAPVAERVAQQLLQPARRSVPTPLSQGNRSAGRDGLRRQPARSSLPLAPRPRNSCGECGIVVRSDRQYCEECLLDRRRDVVQASGFESAGPEALAKLREQKRAPTQRKESMRKYGDRIRERRREEAEWDAAHDERPDPALFRNEILPSLQDVPLSVLMRATSLSRRHCSRIRRGLAVPHPRHWGALGRVAEGV